MASIRILPSMVGTLVPPRAFFILGKCYAGWCWPIYEGTPFGKWGAVYECNLDHQPRFDLFETPMMLDMFFDGLEDDEDERIGESVFE